MEYPLAEVAEQKSPALLDMLETAAEVALLEGITRRRAERRPWSNPNPHSPTAWQNRVLIDVVGPDGERKQHVELEPANVMNTYGLFRLASLVGSPVNFQGTNLFGAIQLGTSTTAASTTDAGLFASTGTQITAGEADATGTWGITYLTTAAGSRTIQVAASFPSNNPSGAATIAEVAVYVYSTTTGNIAARSALGTASVAKGASDSIQISYQFVATTA